LKKAFHFRIGYNFGDDSEIKMEYLLALMVANILLFWGSEQKILHPAGIWIPQMPERFASESS